MQYQPDVTHASGIGGGAGGSYTYKGDFDQTIWNIWDDPVYFVDQNDGKVGARFVYNQELSPDGLSNSVDPGGNEIPARQEQFIFGNVGINNTSGCPEDQSTPR